MITTLLVMLGRHFFKNYEEKLNGQINCLTLKIKLEKEKTK